MVYRYESLYNFHWFFSDVPNAMLTLMYVIIKIQYTYNPIPTLSPETPSMRVSK